MTLDEFSREYDDLSEARRERGWRSLLMADGLIGIEQVRVERKKA